VFGGPKMQKPQPKLGVEEIMDFYSDLPQIHSDLEVDVELLKMAIDNGEYPRVNRYLAQAREAMLHALSALSDAEFHLDTGG